MRLAAALAAIALAAPAAERISFRSEPGRIHVLADGAPFTTFHYDAKWDKPFLHPLRTASGVVISRGYPLAETAGESRDHAWHRGVFWGHGDVNGVDFWRELGRDKTGRLVLARAPKTSHGTIVADMEMVAPNGEALGTVREQIRFAASGGHRFIDFAVTVRAGPGRALKLGDTEEAFLGIRFRDEFRQDRGATLANSEGLQTTEKIWGKRARWTDYTATIDGRQAGAALLDHPSNPKHPTWWHARGYGLNAANPFGERDFTGDKSRDGSLTIPARGESNFRYRIILHDGAGEPSRIEQLWKAFVGRP